MNDDELGACSELRDDLAELALGLLSGRERSETLAHVAACERCTHELGRLSAVLDELLLLVPEVEPPVGFELRLAERLQGEAPVSRSPRFWRLGVFASAAVVAILLGVGIGWLATGHSGSGSGGGGPTVANLTAATLRSDGRALGEVYLSAGRPASLFMAIDGGTETTTVWCEVTLADGKVERIGQFRLADGYGAWAASLPEPSSSVRSARLVTASGAVLASAALS